MASSLRVNAIVPSSGTNVAIGTAGGTVTYAASVSGVSTFSSGIVVSAGSTSAPSISPTGDSNTGIFFPSADTVAFAEGGVEALRINSSGNLGVGTADPTSKLTVLGPIQIQNDAAASGRLTLRAKPGNSYRWCIDNDGGTNAFRVFREDDATAASGVTYMSIDTSGNLQLPTAGTSILNSSGRKILNQTGSILQVVQTVKTDTFYSATNETWYDITGMSATITPSSTSSRILVEFNLGKVCGLNNNAFRIMRNGSLMSGAGDAAGSRQQAHFTESNQGRDANHTGSLSYTYVDSPATTSAVTYQLQVRAEVYSSQGFGLNRTFNDNDSTAGYSARCSSTVLLMEISG